MEYFTGATDKFYRGRDGFIYLKGDGSNTYKNKLISGMSIDMQFRIQFQMQFEMPIIPTIKFDSLNYNENNFKRENKCVIKDEWLEYECKIHNHRSKIRKQRKKRKQKVTKNNQKHNDQYKYIDLFSKEDLMYNDLYIDDYSDDY